MAKLVTTRYEYALYDDTQGTLVPTTQVPPKYPPTLDGFQAGSIVSANGFYGYQRFSSTAAAGSIVCTPQSSLLFLGDSSNTTLLQVQQASVSAVPGAAAAPLYVYVGPSQSVTVPFSLNSGTFVVQPVTTAFVATTAAWALTLFVVA